MKTILSPLETSLRKYLIPVLVVLTVTAVTTPTANAQILWATPSAITGTSDIATNGTYFDAIKGSTVSETADQVIGDTNFHIITSSGTEVDGPGHISLSNLAAANGGDGFFTSASPSSAAYANVLSGVSYDSVGNPVGTITLSGLTSGNQYQVEIWNATSTATSENDPTVYSGVTPVELSQSQFALGTFTASGSTNSFTFSSATDGNGFGVISAVAVRDISEVPEPSAYAMMFAGLAILGLCIHRKARAPLN